ncbi:hypothetical protein MD484_g4381, partial [Candolleomyces efflorescens]
MSFIFRSWLQTNGIPNLREYTTQATLPPLQYEQYDSLLPPPGHVSHKNHLTIRPEAYRQLETIHGLAESVWMNMGACLDSFVPQTHIRTNTVSGDGLTIPYPLPKDPPGNLEGRPDHIHRLIPWIDRLPFATVARILHLSLPETCDWAFRPAAQSHIELDPELFSYYTWSPRTLPSDYSIAKAMERKRMLVAIQPPWILTLRDLEQFAGSRCFPPFVVPGPEDFPSYSSKDRLWAKMWDACVREKLHFFVLTSYTHWVFGFFSKGYTQAWTTDILPFDSQSPTIIEALTYWVASAMRLPGGILPPKVFAAHSSNPWKLPQPNRCECVVFDEDEGSESDWGGSSLASDESSAGVCPTVLTCTDGGVLERNLYSPNKKNVFPLIHNWLDENDKTQMIDPILDDHTTERYWQDPIEESPFVWEVLQRKNLLDQAQTPDQVGRLPCVGEWLV